MKKEKITNVKNFNFAGHEFKKSLGQNFISDGNLLSAIVVDSGVTGSDYVLEIGAGAGTLSAKIAEKAKKVVSLEVDESLRERLELVQSEHENLKVVFKDIMKVDILKEVDDLFGDNVEKLHVIANLPYYITTPILFKLFEVNKLIKSITVMVQKEVAERMVAPPKSSNYAVLPVMVGFYGKAKIARIVGKNNFYPAPKVDSAIIKIDLFDDIDNDFAKQFAIIVKNAFQNRRKVLISNLTGINNVSKEGLISIFERLQISLTARAEELTIEQFKELTKEIYG